MRDQMIKLKTVLSNLFELYNFRSIWLELSNVNNLLYYSYIS